MRARHWIVLGSFAALLAIAPLGAPGLAGPPRDFEELKAEAEKLYAEKSYARAHALYLEADALELPAREARWVDFRVADTLWRAAAGSETADDTKFQQARSQLETLIRDVRREEDRDLVWAEVHESLADFWWTPPRQRNWGAAWGLYETALDFWAGSEEIDRARERYLSMVWRMARPPQPTRHYYYGYHGNNISIRVLENALKIATTPEEKAHAHFLIARSIQNQGGAWEQRQRVPEEFEAAIDLGKKTDWYDDALFQYGEWMASYGRIIPLEGGQWRQEPDYVKAVKLYRRLMREFDKGETRWWDQAKNRIQQITDPQVGVGISNIFLPDSEVQYHLSWRNAKQVFVAIYGIDLTEDVSFAGKDIGSYQYLQTISIAGRERVLDWQHDTGDKGDHRPGSASLHLEKKLPAGAYLIEARAEGKTARDLILVTDTTAVLQATGNRALVYVADALRGKPIGGARVRLWERNHDGNRWVWSDHEAKTDGQGVADFPLPETARQGYSRDYFVGVAREDSQAFSVGNGYRPYGDQGKWRVYAYTDRPAYRPEEKVSWKVVARRYSDGAYHTPAGQKVLYEIQDPRNQKVADGELDLNAFGSAWAELDLTKEMPLGEYRVSFSEIVQGSGKKEGIGDATLFRLEEYKLPEYRVTIRTPEEEGKKKAFRVGETVEVEIEAEYYFGGPVTGATAEVIVYQRPFYHWWTPRRQYPWYYEDLDRSPWHWWGGPGNVILQETHKTDDSGQLVFTFETPRGAGQDFEYRIEARVVDQSRREIRAVDSVRVTRQRYFVYLRPRHSIYRPSEKVTVDVTARDANDQPVEVEGEVALTRDYWYEIWIDPDGNEVKGDALKRLRAEIPIFPPPPEKGRPGWTLKFRGYQHDEIKKSPVKTDAEGKAEYTFTPEREGYYRVAWTSQDPGAPPIQTQTTVWVAEKTSRDLGYHQGGVEIIADKDTFTVGQKAPILLSVPTNDRYVLFTVEAEGILEHRVVHVEGTVKLVELDVEERHVPNVFLGAVLVQDREVHHDIEQIVVPPTRHFLDVEVKLDKDEYQPREKGQLLVKTRDHEGKPVSAEVSLALIDESVFAIQSDYAADPRQHFFGRKRSHGVRLTTTFQQKRYAKYRLGEDKNLIEVASTELMDEMDAFGYGVGGAAGGRDGALRELAAAPAEESEGLYEADDAGPAMAPKAASRRSRGGERADYKKGKLSKEEQRSGEPAGDEGGGDWGESPDVVVRSDFRTTILWQPDVVTDADGVGTVDVQFPDSLTGWRATARALGKGSQFGVQTGATRTRQPLIVRLQAPRFFVVGDEVTISAVMNNNTKEPMRVQPDIEAEGLKLIGPIVDGAVREGEETGPVTVAPGSEKRVDWRVSVLEPGVAKITVAGSGPEHADGMAKSYLVYEHGMEKLVARAGKVRGKDVTIKLDIPEARKPETTELGVTVSPSIAVTMLDALPYLIDYPYGCTEQTMSRFLPSVITLKTMRDLGLDEELVATRIFGGIEEEHVEKTQPKGKQDLAKLDDMVKKGLARLYDFQHADGGWGWWKEGESDHFMTAYVLWGLALAQEADIEVKAGVADRAAKFLDLEIVEEEENPDMAAFLLHALAVHADVNGGKRTRLQEKAFDKLWKDRDGLNAYTRSLFALAAHHYGDTEKAETLARNLENGVKIDETPDTSVVQRGEQESHAAVIKTAHWGSDGIWWRWSHGPIESTSFALRALLRIDPDSELIEPVMNWLVKNRRGAQWSNTRDTAITVLALNDYLVASGELKPEMEFELFVNGESLAKRKLTAEEALTRPSRIVVPRERIKDGENEIRIVRADGEGAIYFAAEATFFSLEEPITPAANEIFVRRQYYKMVPRPTLLKGVVYHKVPLEDGESVQSGVRVEAEITIEAKNDYQYLVFEDLKPAGLEATSVKSGLPLYTRELKSGAVERHFGGESGDGEEGKGETAGARRGGGAAVTPAAAVRRRKPLREAEDYTGRSRWVYQELRDRKVALFVDRLPEGVWEIRYELRAEVPGVFHALPVKGHAMYVPEIRCNGAEQRITVTDVQEF